MTPEQIEEVISLGLRILPTKDKRSLIKDWPNAASRDPEQIRSWWKQWPHAQPAAVVPEDITIFDIDIRNDGSLEALETVTGPLPETLTSWSGRGDGGRHLWFKKPAGEISAQQLPKGVDLRKPAVHYVLIPPALHNETGKPYTWNDVPFVAELPAQAIDALRPPAKPDVPLPAVTGRPGSSHGLVRTVTDAVEGQRNNALLWAACRAFDNGDTEVIQDLFDAAISNGLTESEVTATIASAERQERQAPTTVTSVRRELEAHSEIPNDIPRVNARGQERPATYDREEPAPKSDAEPLASTDGLDVSDGLDGSNTAPETTWQPVDLTAYVNGTYEPAEPALLARDDGVALLYQGKVHSLNGESESGKSMVALTEVSEQLKNGDKVLFLDYESDPATVVDRLLKMGTPKDKLNSLLDYVQPEVDPVTSTVHELQQWQHILSQQYTLAVLDGVTESLGTCNASSMDNDEVAHWMRKVPRAIADNTGAATLLIDHVTKSRESRGRFAIGAQSKLSSLSGASYIVEPVEPLGVGLKGRLQVKVAKDRPGRVRPHSVGWDKQDRMAIIADIVIDSTNPAAIDYQISKPETPATTADMDTELKQRIVSSIRALQKIEPPSWSKIRADVSGNNDSKKNALNELIAEGKVTVTAGPRNSTLHTVPPVPTHEPESVVPD